MVKNQKVVLKIGRTKVFEEWVSTKDEGDESALRYLLRVSLKSAISRQKGK